ncbi:MAG TPA: hypothetical protein VER32_14175 [Pyrinomonadaceae bacterium]|nr:hypothetical protein [Pyrinomonadaceae bacterium]
MKRRATTLLLITLTTLGTISHATARADDSTTPAGAALINAYDDESEARAAIEHAFERLRAGDYAAVYDTLPTASQRRISRARFVEGLSRTRGIFTLERLEIERVRVAGNLAVVDSTLYASVNQPFSGEGKIVSRQYLVREGGRWRVTTGERATIRPLLAANPSFARQFPPTEPRVYLKRDGRWVTIDSLAPRRKKQ